MGRSPASLVLRVGDSFVLDTISVYSAPVSIEQHFKAQVAG